MDIPSKSRALLKKGKMDIKVKRAGTLQFQEFVVKKIPSPVGEYVVLHVENFIDLSELLRLAEEYKLPISAKNGVAFPQGTASRDFVKL